MTLEEINQLLILLNEHAIHTEAVDRAKFVNKLEGKEQPVETQLNELFSDLDNRLFEVERKLNVLIDLLEQRKVSEETYQYKAIDDRRSALMRLGR